MINERMPTFRLLVLALAERLLLRFVGFTLRLSFWSVEDSLLSVSGSFGDFDVSRLFRAEQFVFTGVATILFFCLADFRSAINFNHFYQPVCTELDISLSAAFSTLFFCHGVASTHCVAANHNCVMKTDDVKLKLCSFQTGTSVESVKSAYLKEK